MTRASRGLIVTLLAVGLWVPVGWSDEPAAPTTSGSQDRIEAAMQQSGVSLALEKLGRGVSNVACGWLEIPLTIGKRYAPADAGTSLVVGTITGLIKGIIRTGVGAYEALTFFLPLPENFAPILPTLEYFQRTAKHQPLLLE